MPAPSSSTYPYTTSARVVYGLVEKPTNVTSPFAPFLSQAFKICTVIADTLDELCYLRETCGRFADRISSANTMLLQLGQNYANLPGKFVTDEFSDAFEEYIVALIAVETFAIKISNEVTLRKLLRQPDHTNTVRNLQILLDDSISSLGLNLKSCIDDENEGMFEAACQDSDTIRSTKDILAKLTRWNDQPTKDIKDILTLEFALIRDHLDNGLSNVTATTKEVLKHKGSDETTEAADMLASAAMINISEVKDLDPDQDSYPDNVKMFHGNMAVKEILVRLRKPEIGKIKREIGMMKAISNCPYVLHTYGMYEQGQNLVVLLEYAEKGKLIEVMEDESLPWSDRWNMSIDISQGISFLHSCSVIHHDIRSENIVVTNRMKAKIANFSVSRIQSGHSVGRDVDQTLHLRWVAPERLQNSQFPHKDHVPYTNACEIYSLGMLLWEIAECNGKTPYENMANTADVVQYVLQGDDNRPPIPTDTPVAFQEIIKAAWKQNPHKRPSAAEVSNMLLKARTEISTISKNRGVPPRIEIHLSDDEPREVGCRSAENLYGRIQDPPLHRNNSLACYL